MRCERSNFASDRSIIKGILLGNQSAFNSRDFSGTSYHALATHALPTCKSDCDWSITKDTSLEVQTIFLVVSRLSLQGFFCNFIPRNLHARAETM